MPMMRLRRGRGSTLNTPYVPVLGDLALSGRLESGVPSSGIIIGATSGSTITSSVPGLTVNSAARTYSYNGAGSAGPVQGLIETLAGATFSPRNNSVTIVSAASPAFTRNPAISPTGGDAATTFTANDGAMSNGGSVLSRRWLLNGTSIGSGTTIVPGAQGSLTLENTGTGNVVATSTAVTVTATATPTPGPQIAWTPDMLNTSSSTLNVLELYEAAAPATLLNAAGTQAAPGENVATWNSRTTNSRSATQATVANQPVLGTSADASPTGVIPLTFRGSAGMRTFANTAKTDRYTIFALMRLKSGVDSSKSFYAIGNTDGNIYNLLQSSSSSVGSLRPLVASQTFEMDTTERVRSFTQNMQIDGVSFSRIQGREDSLNTTASGSSLASGASFVLGNNANNNGGGLLDFFAFAFVNANVSRANQQRMEGYLAHRAGLASVALESTHPYRDAPPMVPAGTTSTLGWIELPAVAAPQQTFMGGQIEVLTDSYLKFVEPATNGTDEAWGFPYSLTTSEQARYKSLLHGATNPLIMYLRYALGFAYRGFRNIDATSGLAKNIGERYSGQNTAIANSLSNVIPLGGGLLAEYWSPAPHWKTTGKYAYGYLTAGGTYSRDTRLDSIRTSDATQYNAQIDAITTAMVADLEYLHQNVAPVRGFGLQNEGISGVDNVYGTCQYTAAEYASVFRVIVPKIRNSAILSSYNGQPNNVLIHVDSYQGFSNAGTTVTNATALSTGKPALQETWAQTIHYINDIVNNPDFLRNQQWSFIASGRGKPTIVNEVEWFQPGDYTDAVRFAHMCAWQLHQVNLLGTPMLLPILHAIKEIPNNGAAHDALGYPLFKARRPAPYGQDPSTPGDYDPTIPYGSFDFVKPNWHAAQFTLSNIPVGSVFRRVDLPTGVSKIAAAAIMVGGKRRIFVVNFLSTAQTLPFTLGAASTFNVQTYTATDAATPAGTVSGPQLSMTFQPYTAYVLTEA